MFAEIMFFSAPAVMPVSRNVALPFVLNVMFEGSKGFFFYQISAISTAVFLSALRIIIRFKRYLSSVGNMFAEIMFFSAPAVMPVSRNVALPFVLNVMFEGSKGFFFYQISAISTAVFLFSLRVITGCNRFRSLIGSVKNSHDKSAFTFLIMAFLIVIVGIIGNKITLCGMILIAVVFDIVTCGAFQIMLQTVLFESIFIIMRQKLRTGIQLCIGGEKFQPHFILNVLIGQTFGENDSFKI